MIERYEIKEISKIFSSKSRYKYFLKVELSVIKAYVKLGIIPNEDYLKIKDNVKVDVNKINELEKETKHDVIAFTRSLSSYLGKEKKWIHYNLTSTDVVDTALSLELKDANKIILKELNSLKNILKEKAIEYKDTPIIGRSHGIHAEVTSFGLKFAYFYDELVRDIKRFIFEKRFVEVAKISGTVGNFANLPYEIEEFVAKDLKLKRANISTQVLSRDRLIGYTYSLASISALLNKIAIEIRHLSRSEVNEVNEYFSSSQKGSSAMPHKRNPIGSENISGLSRIVTSSLFTSFLNNPLWHERDISHSSNERIYIPDDIHLTIYMLRRMNNILSNLVVNKENMLDNINSTYGVIYSGKLLNYLISVTNLSRETLYDHIQALSFKAINEKINLKDLVYKDELINKLIKEYNIDSNKIDEIFSFNYVFKNIDLIYKKVGLIK